MKKNVFYIAACLMIFTSCENGTVFESSESELELRETAPVNLTFFDVSLEDVTTPATSRADDEDSSLKENGYFSRLDVAFFPLYSSNEVYQIHQISDSTNFGKISTSLPIGSYKLVAMAHNLDAQFEITDTTSVTSPIEDELTDIAYIYTSLNVGTDGNTSACQLERPIAGFKLQSTDVSPDTVYSIRLTLGSGCSNTFNPSTSFAIDKGEYSVIKVLNRAYVGTTRGVNFYMFVEQETEYENIRADVLDKNGNILNQFDFEDVLLVQGKRTTYTGQVFSYSKEIEFSSSISAMSDIEDSGGSTDF